MLDVGMGLVDHAETVPGTSRVEWRTEMRQTVLPRLVKCVLGLGCCERCIYLMCMIDICIYMCVYVCLYIGVGCCEECIRKTEARSNP